MDQEEIRRLAEEAGWDVKEDKKSTTFSKSGKPLTVAKPVAPQEPLANIGRRFDNLRLNQLKLDDTYQRDLDPGWVEYLEKHWKLLNRGVLTISQRSDGSMWIVDGQHRWQAMLRLNFTDTPCEIYTGLTVEQEAGLFNELNTRKSVHPLSRFRARVVAKEPVALAITKILRELGTRVSWRTDAGYPCVVALERAYNRGTLQDVVEILEATWPNEDVRHNPTVVGAMSFFLHRYATDDFNMDRAIKRLEIHPLKSLLVGAKGDAIGTDQSQLWWLALSFSKIYKSQPKRTRR